MLYPLCPLPAKLKQTIVPIFRVYDFHTITKRVNCIEVRSKSHPITFDIAPYTSFIHEANKLLAIKFNHAYKRHI